MSTEIMMTCGQVWSICGALRAVFDAGRTPHETPTITAAQMVAGSAAKMLRDLLSGPEAGEALGLAWVPAGLSSRVGPDAVGGALLVQDPTMLHCLLNAAVQTLMAQTADQKKSQARKAALDWADEYTSPHAFADGLSEELSKAESERKAMLRALADLQQALI